MRLLVRLPNWLGDVVMATPALRVLRRGHLQAHITVLGKRALLPVLEGASWFDEALAIEELGDPIRQGLALRKRRFDRAVLLPSSWSTTIVARVAGIRERFGYAQDGRGLLLTHRLATTRIGRLRPFSKVSVYARLALLAGGKADGDDLALALPDVDEARVRAAAWFAAHGVASEEPIVAMHVGASFGLSKLWLADRWAAVADRLAARGHRVIVYGGPADKPAVQAVLRAATTTRIVEATDVPLRDLAAHMRRARLALATDSGGRHVSIAAGVPTVVVMGPNHPGYSEAPVGRYAVLLAKPPCWPCHLRVCPIDHRCMTAITVDDVMGLAETYLAGEDPCAAGRPWETVPGLEHAGHFTAATG